MQGRHIVVACLLAVGVLLLAGCSSTKTLGSTQSVVPFVRDVVNGDTAHWRLGAKPSLEAKRAWQHRQRIEAVTKELREGQEWWGCISMALLRNGASEHTAAIAAEHKGAGIYYVDTLIETPEQLTPTELGAISSVLCPGR